MASRHVSNYVKKRFIGHRNLLKILRKQKVPIKERDPKDPKNIYETFDPQNEVEFRIAWGEKQNNENRTVIFERDNIPELMQFIDQNNPENSYFLLVVYMVPESGSERITHSMIDNYLKPRLIQLGFTGDTYNVNNTIQIILITETVLDGMARNQLVDFNLLLKRGIRHFTLDELQYDPTEHINQPKSIEKALEEPEYITILEIFWGLKSYGAKTEDVIEVLK